MALCEKILRVISVVALTLFILLGILIVLIQIVGLVTLNGPLMTAVRSVEAVSIAAAGILGISSFLLTYFHRRDKKLPETK